MDTHMNSILSSFIVFEGLDGSGKSTQARLLCRNLEKKGLDAVLTAEPTDNPVGCLVRQVLRHQVDTTSQALALLYAADRSDHLFNRNYGITKLLESGKTVISDRYFYSSLSYQGVTEDKTFLARINDYPHPEFVIFVDTPAEVCMQRIDKRGEEKELFDRLDYLRKVRANFLSVFSALPAGVKYLRVDGEKTISEQEEEISSFLSL